MVVLGNLTARTSRHTLHTPGEERHHHGMPFPIEKGVYLRVLRTVHVTVELKERNGLCGRVDGCRSGRGTAFYPRYRSNALLYNV